MIATCLGARGRNRARVAAVILAVAVSLVATAAAGWTHADLVASEPGASETVADPLGEVLLEFSEPLIERSPTRR